MSDTDRKARKLRERKERIRREKHERRSLPKIDDLPEEEPELALPPDAPAGPRRFAAEQGLHDLHKLIGDRQFKSIEEANAFLAGAMKSGRLEGIEDLPKDDRETARDLAYQAMDASDPDEIERLARRALSHDPECVDAMRMLAFVTSASPRERIAKFAEAVRTGERALGEKFFEENRGHFWGLLETRPYMRARYDLATALLKDGETGAGMGHLEAMLELNPGDNMGVRYDLLPRYLEAGAIEPARRLLDAYPKDYSAAFHWCRVLEQWLSGRPARAAKALAAARKMNPYVEAYLTGRRPLPRQLPDQYSPGQPSEAAIYARELRNCWLAHREALAWLKEQRPRG